MQRIINVLNTAKTGRREEMDAAAAFGLKLDSCRYNRIENDYIGKKIIIKKIAFRI